MFKSFSTSPFNTFGWKMLTLLFLVLCMSWLGSWATQSIIWLLLGPVASDDISLEVLMQSHPGLARSMLALNHVFVFILSSVIFLWTFYRKNMNNYLQVRHFPTSYTLLFPLALIAIFPLMGFLSQWTDSLSLPEFLNNLDQRSMASLETFLSMDGYFDLIMNIVIIGIIAGTGEELLFRGIIQKEIMLKIHNPHVSIWITGLIFSLLHFQVSGFFPKWIIGCILGYSYYFSQSLVLPIFLHIFNNSFATLSLFFWKNQVQTVFPQQTTVPVATVIISMIVFLWLFSIIYKSKVSQNQNMDEYE